MNREAKEVAVMTYTITDIVELVEYHLVASAPDDDVAHANLVQLELLARHPLYREATWVFCDRYGCSVDTDLIHPYGHCYAGDGDFYRADCWENVTSSA